jgi:hypothetical protein
MQDTDKQRRDEIYSTVVKAGKRTYFFDVKETRNGDYYLTLTESKKIYDDGGNFRYEKHKLFLYKEDFSKFSDALAETIGFIREKFPEEEALGDTNAETNESVDSTNEFTDVKFDDLGESTDNE